MKIKEILLKKFRESTGANEIDLSDRTINETLDVLGLPEDEGDIDSFVEKYTPIFNTVAGQTRAVAATVAKKFEEDGNTDPKKKGEPQKEQPKTDMEARYEALMSTIEAQSKNIEALSTELTNIKTHTTRSSIEKQLSEYAKSKNLVDDYVLGVVKSKISYEDKDIESLQKELETLYSDEFKKCRGTEPTFASSGGYGKDEDAEWDEYFKTRDEEEAMFNPKKEVE